MEDQERAESRIGKWWLVYYQITHQAILIRALFKSALRTHRVIVSLQLVFVSRLRPHLFHTTPAPHNDCTGAGSEYWARERDDSQQGLSKSL